MSDFFGREQRALQQRCETRAVADAVVSVTVHDGAQDTDRAFIESRDRFFFLSTVNERGEA